MEPNIKELIDELRRFADNRVHPIVSPDHWNVYSQLVDSIDELDESLDQLLKEQEAKKPIYNEEKYGDFLPHCSSCGEVLPNVCKYGKAKFCAKCGQKVKWDD